MFYNIDYTPYFKKEWSWIETEGVMAILAKLFKEHYRIKDIEEKFGLPHTSSSEFAMISNSNCKFEIEPGIYLDWFALKDSDYPQIIAGATDKDENEFYYIVE